MLSSVIPGTHVALGTKVDTSDIFTLSDHERRNGLYILGRSGFGKSTLIKNLIFQDIRNGHGVFFIDPTGDAIDDLLAHIPDERKDDVFVLDPSDETHTFGINLFSCLNPQSLRERSTSYARAEHIFTKLFANPQTAALDILLSVYLPNVFYPLLATQGLTILEIPLLLRDKAFRATLLRERSIPAEVLDFWQEEFEALGPHTQREETASTRRRITLFRAHEYVKHIVGQAQTTIDFTHIMDNRKILFVKLSATLAKEEQNIIGTMLLSNLVYAITQREAVPEAKRRHFCIFIDEFERFASSDDVDFLFTQARKYAIATTVAHQNRSGQFADNKRLAGATDAAGVKLFFRQSAHDAQEQAVEFAERAKPTEIHREAELVISPHPIEDIVERGHPEEELMSIRERYLWIVEALRSKPQEPYFLFDRSHIKPEYMQSNPVNFRFEDFDDWEWYRSSADDIRRGISLLNQYYYDCMRGTYNGSGKGITNPQLQLMQTVIVCLGAVFGFLPMHKPYIPEPMRVALFRALMQHKPRSSLYFTSMAAWYDSGAREYKRRTWLMEHELKRLINAPEFPRPLLPSWIWERITEDERYGWRIDTHTRYNSYERRMELCRLLLGIKSDAKPTIDDIPPAFSNQAELHCFQKLATYIGMPMHELEHLVEWEIQPLTCEEKAALADMVTLIATMGTDKPYYEKNSKRIYSHYGDALSKRLGAQGSSEKATNRQIWQMGELVFFIGMCLEAAPRWLRAWPIKIASGKYIETLKVERTQQDLNNDMVQELLNLQPGSAYVKSAAGKAKIQTPPFAPSAPTVDMRLGARDNAIDARMLKKRSDIEAEIQKRRQGGGNDPPPDTGGNSPPSLPSAPTGDDDEPPPISYVPSTPPDEKPPYRGEGGPLPMDTAETDEAQATQEGSVIDFTAYARKRKEEAAPRQMPKENASVPRLKLPKPRPQELPIPRYEPLDYSSGHVSVQEFRDHLAPLLRAQIVNAELCELDGTVASYALTLGDRSVGSRVLHRMLQNNSERPSQKLGLLALLVGETVVAEHLIQELEKCNDEYSDCEAAAIAAKLPDTAQAKRFQQQFEAKGNQAAALHIAVEMGDTETMNRLLVEILQYGNIDATWSYFRYMTEALRKALPYNPPLGTSFVRLIDKLREVAKILSPDLPKSEKRVPEQVYRESAGTLAALLGEKAYALRAIDFFLYERALVPAAVIAAHFGDVAVTELIVSKYHEVTRDRVQLDTSQVGSIIGTIAHHNLQAAEKMWLLFAEKFSESSTIIARTIIEQLDCPPLLRQHHPMSLAPSTDPLSHLTQSTRGLTGAFGELEVTTEQCIQAIRGGSPPPLLPGHTGEDREPPPISSIPPTPPEENPPGTKSLASRQKDLPAGESGLPVEFVSLRFFEHGQGMPAQGERQYSTRFSRHTARFVNVELTMRMRLESGRSTRVRVRTHYYLTPATSLFKWQEEDYVVYAAKDSRPYQWGFGALEPGSWQPGAYRVVILINGVQFAEDSFTIEEASPVAAHVPTSPKLPPSRSTHEEESFQVRNWALERGRQINDQSPLSPEKPPAISDTTTAIPATDEREAARESQPGKIIDLSSHQQKQREYEMASGMISPDANAFDPLPSRLSPALAPDPRQLADIELLSLQFYEAGEETILRAKRQYSAQFPQRSTRFIHFELTLLNHNRQREKTYQVTYRYLTQDGQRKWEQQDDYIVQSNWTRCWFTRGCGFADAGRWEPGTYRVEIFIDGVPLTEGSFTIQDDRPSFTLDSLHFFASGKDVPTKGQRQYDTHFPQTTTRYVNFELCLHNPLYGWRNQDFRLHARYLNPDGSLLWEVKRKVVLTARDQSFAFAMGTGDERPAYMSGTYRVEIFIDGVPLTEGSFTIEEDTRQGAPAPRSAQMSSTPSFTLESLQFFESGTAMAEYGQRQYDTHFPREFTRQVYYELSMSRSAHKQKALTYHVEDRYYNPDGSLLGTRRYEEGVESGWESWRTVSGRGWLEYGRWKPGTYRVEILINGDTLTEGSFTIE